MSGLSVRRSRELVPSLRSETVLSLRRWSAKMFSFRTTRSLSFRFESGQFIMLGLKLDGRSVMRAYSIASPSYEDHLEYLSIVVPDGKLTSALSRVKPGDEVMVAGKATGTLLIGDLRPGRTLYLLATGTGLAPFMAIVRDPATYERFEKVILVHCVRYAEELAYRSYLCEEMTDDDFIGAAVREQLVYYPTVTMEPFLRQGRIPFLIESGRLENDIGLPPLDASCDRVMICGNPQMLLDTRALLDRRGFQASPTFGLAGDYVYERAFTGPAA